MPKAAKIVGPIDQIHEVDRTLDERVFVPAHAPRTESPGYKAIHKKLVYDDDRPCLVCGVRASILKDPAKAKDKTLNPATARAMETHHRMIEWSLINAIDLGKFNKHIVGGLRRHHPDVLAYQRDFTQQEMEDFIDHGDENLWVLCDVHHRSKFVGIHSISGPIWSPQDLLKPGYKYTPYDPQHDAAPKPGTGNGTATKKTAKKTTGSKKTRKR